MSKWTTGLGFFGLSLLVAACSAPASDGQVGNETDEPEIIEDGPVPPTAQRCESTKVVDANLRRLTAREFQATLADVFPEIAATWSGVAMGTDPEGRLGFVNDSSTLVVGNQTADEIFRTGTDLGALLTSDGVLSGVLPCAGDADRACAGTFIDTYGERMYRAVLSADQREELLVYFDSVLSLSDFKTAMKWMVAAMVQSPYFVYRSELGQDGKLTPEEVVTQLSYVYSGKAPSSDQLRRAREGEFDSPEGRINEARALSATPEGRAVFHDFFSQWTRYEGVLNATKEGLEESIIEIRDSMVQETRLFFEEVVFNQGGGPKDLVDANFTFTNATLADLYGFGEAGATMAKSTRPEGQGLGLLAQGSILAFKAHNDVTSPVTRGVFVFEKLLCDEAPPVPGDLDIGSVQELPPANTTRERFETIHAASPACSTCHQRFEPFGFGMEDFDEAGRFRNVEFNEEQMMEYPVDTAASVEMRDGTTLSFDGSSQLSSELAALPVVTDCVSGLLAGFAFSGAGGKNCLAESERGALADGSIGLEEFFVQLAGSPNMVERRR